MARSFLTNKDDNQRLKTVESIDECDGQLVRYSSQLKFMCSIKNDTIKEVFTYNETINYVSTSEEENLIEWKFKSITGHEGYIPKFHPSYNGSLYNLRIEWEMGR